MINKSSAQWAAPAAACPGFPRHRRLGLAACTALMELVCSLAAADAPATNRLSVLILSGRNNHDWRQTTPALRRILEQTGRFTVEVTEDPSRCDRATFARCQVVVGNWSAWPDVTGRQWGPVAEQAFVDFVRGGGGFAVFHAGCATSYDWPEYQRMCCGFWDLKTTGHGPIHEFQVSFTGAPHPVTQGLANFFIRDELWHRLGIQTNKTVLATAFSAPDKGGSGQNEPVVMTTQFGQGRCFHLVLGHDAATMENQAWKTLMTRGIEWAATGRVTLPPPASWPDHAAGGNPAKK